MTLLVLLSLLFVLSLLMALFEELLEVLLMWMSAEMSVRL